MSDLVSFVDGFTHQGFTSVHQKNHYNEDRLFIGRSIFAVIDGATALIKMEKDGLNASAYTARFLAQFFMEHDHTERSAKELLLKANTDFKAHLKTEWPEVLDAGKLGPCAAVSVVKIHDKNTATISNIADCGIVTKDKKGTYSQVSEHYQRHAELDSDLAAAIFEKLDMGLSLSDAKKHNDIVTKLENNRSLSNVEYGNFTAEEDMQKFLKSKELNLKNIETITLFSDGYLWPDAESEQEGMLKAARLINLYGAYQAYQKIKAAKDKKS